MFCRAALRQAAAVTPSVRLTCATHPRCSSIVIPLLGNRNGGSGKKKEKTIQGLVDYSAYTELVASSSTSKTSPSTTTNTTTTTAAAAMIQVPWKEGDARWETVQAMAHTLARNPDYSLADKKRALQLAVDFLQGKPIDSHLKLRSLEGTQQLRSFEQLRAKSSE